MIKKRIVTLVIASCLVLSGTAVWADNDADQEVDNRAPTVSYVGGWGTSSTQPSYGVDYRVTQTNGTATPDREVTFRSRWTLDVTGEYEVHVRYSSHPTNRTTNAQYRVYNGTGAATPMGSCSVNQTNLGNTWVYCGTYNFTGGQYGVVRLGNNGFPAGRLVIADAVRFVRVTKDGADIADNTITSADIANGTVTGADIANSTITGSDIASSTITGSDIASNSIPSGDLSNEAGIDFSGATESNLTSISANCSATTNVSIISMTIPSSGYVWVHANGIAELTTADRWVRVGIDDASSGSTFDSYAPFLENIAAEVTAMNYEDERRYTVSNVYYFISGGTKTFYLKACKETGATGRLMWDDFVAMYFPTRY